MRCAEDFAGLERQMEVEPHIRVFEVQTDDLRYAVQAVGFVTTYVNHVPDKTKPIGWIR